MSIAPTEYISKIDPKVDVAFKFLASKPGIMVAMINDLFRASGLPLITELKVVNGELTKQRMKERGATLDFLALDQNNLNINIEVQVEHHGGFLERLLFHWAKIHVSQFRKGRDYSLQKISPTVIIALTDFTFLDENSVLNHYQIINTETSNPLPKKLFNLMTLELPKFSTSDLGSLWAPWAALFVNDKKYETVVRGYPMTSKAIEFLETMSMDSDLATAYLDHLELLNDEAAKLLATRNEALMEGEIRGETKGEIKGKIEGKIEIAQGMINDGCPDELIARYTSLSIENIQEIRKSLG